MLDAFSRKVVGWSIDSTQTAALVTNALGMAIRGRDPDRTVIHSDRGTQFTSWTFTQRVREAELMPSVGRTGTALDNAMMESFWGRMQVELLNRRRWRTRVNCQCDLRIHRVVPQQPPAPQLAQYAHTNGVEELRQKESS